MGMAMARHLKPTRLVLLGTPGSMWDVFFEREAEGQVLEQTEQWQMLSDAVLGEAVTADMLQSYSCYLSQRMGMQVECRLISPARDNEQQLQLLHDLADAIPQNEILDLDVTHSYRHLPMLALVAARYLARVKGVQVRDIYYGAFDMTDPVSGETPVVRLGGLLRMLDWVEGLAGYDRDGDYSIFARLLEQDGLAPQHARLLQEAAFHERMNNTVRARQSLQSVMPSLQAHTGSMGRLFLAQLLKRLSWFKEPKRDEQELRLAQASLERRDYLRAAILLQEAVISRDAAWQSDGIDNFEARKQCLKEAEKNDPQVLELSYLRNGMAHTVAPSNKKTFEILKNEATLSSKLRQLKDHLFSRR